MLTRRNLLHSSAMLASTFPVVGHASITRPQRYSATVESLGEHRVPSWFDDAKFGVFIHWGPYSIPAFAPVPASKDEAQAPGSRFATNPYAEWYLNTMLFPDSATAAYHRDIYGDGYDYRAFGDAFNESLADWDPDEWADHFARSGAGYVVLVTKHHDGFTLWPSDVPNPNAQGWSASRDIVGELGEAVRRRGMRYGLYYSGGVDWTFKHKRIEELTDLFTHMPGEAEGYTRYANAHYAELIDRYRPDYLWNDIGYPTRSDAHSVIARYYNAVPDGLVNDRWISPPELADPTIWERPPGSKGLLPPRPSVWDVRTPEYAAFDTILDYKWESTRGVGYSFGFNRMEGDEHLLASSEAVRMLVAAASYGGNLLLNVGPRPDAKLDPAQVERLQAIGSWLETYGEGLFATRPVAIAGQGGDVSATGRGQTTFIHYSGRLEEGSLSLPLPANTSTVDEARVLGQSDASVALQGGRLVISASHWPDTPVLTVAGRFS